MKKILAAAFTSACLALGSAGPARATLISDPGQLTDSTIDVDFDTLLSAPNLIISGTSNGFFNATGFGATFSFPTFVSGVTYRVDPGTLTLDFASPVFEVGFGLFDANFIGTGFEAFDANGNSLTGGFVQADVGPPGGSFATYMGLQETSNIISQVVITADSGDLLGLDNISFSAQAVPAPATAGILLLGVAAIAVRGRRKRIQ